VLPAIDAAMAVCQQVARQLHGPDRHPDAAEVALAKADESPVTVADFAGQALIVRALQRYFPGEAVVGEESAELLREPSAAGLRAAIVELVRPHWPGVDEAALLAAIDGGTARDPGTDRWTLDPIDGTRGFVRGGQYAVCLAWLVDDRPLLGVLGCPALAPDPSAPLAVQDPRGVVLWAVEGGPAMVLPGGADPRASEAESGARLAASAPLERGPEQLAPIVLVQSVDRGHTDQDAAERAFAALGRPYTVLHADSQAKYGLVARGQAHALVRVPTSERAEWIWDHAPGDLLARAAGCVVSDLDGRALDFGHGARLVANRGLVCAHPAVHAPLLRALQRELGREGAAPA